MSYRSQLGPELEIVVLDMALEEQMKRIQERSKGEESAVELCKVGVSYLRTVTPVPGNL